jgi:hypothetical protein
VPDKSARCHPIRPVRRPLPATWSGTSSDGGPLWTFRTVYQREQAIQAAPRVANGWATLTGKKAFRPRSRPELDGHRQLDRLPLDQARPGQSHHLRPTYLAPDKDSLFCRNEGVACLLTYAQAGIVIHGLPILPTIPVRYFPSF